MSQNSNSDAGPPDGNSAVPAMFQFPAELHLDGPEIEYAKIKCTTCNLVTEHEWFEVAPQPCAPVEPLELIKLRKKILLCTQCGKLSLKQ